MSKIYFWLKFDKNFFEQKEIKKIRSVQGGDTSIIIYQKMLLLALETDNVIYFDNIFNSIEEEIAIEINEKYEQVKFTLELLKALNLVIFFENTLEFTRILELVGKETESARRVRKHRKLQEITKIEDKKALHCNADVIKCNTEIRDKIKDKRVNINKDIKEKNIKDKDIKEKKTLKKQVFSIQDFFIKNKIENEELKEALKSFEQHRKSLKKQLTEQSLIIILNKFKNWNYNSSECIECLENSIMNGWQGVFELKKDNFNKKIKDKNKEIIFSFDD